MQNSIVPGKVIKGALRVVHEVCPVLYGQWRHLPFYLLVADPGVKLLY